MNKLFVFVCLAFCIGSNLAIATPQSLALDMKWDSFDFIAPSVYDAAVNAPIQTGSVVYDTRYNAFYGNDNNGSWVLLSAPSTAYVQSTASVANYAITAGIWGDLTSLTLAAGEWDIMATVVYSNNGAGTAQSVSNAIGTASGTSLTGVTNGDNDSSGWLVSNTSGSVELATSFHVTPTSTTTYYLKSNVNSSITNVQVSYKMWARKVR